MPALLLTGFAPFGGETTNPAMTAVQTLDGARLRGHRVVVAQLPVSFADAVQQLDAALAAHAPALVLCTGQAGGRERLSFERVAVNLIDARIADNDGQQPVDQPVVAGAPAAYFTTLPVKRMQAALQSAGIPAGLSLSAGSYVCNQVFFALMHRLHTRPQVRGGFVHVPYSPQQACHHPGAPSLPTELVAHGLRLALETALDHHDDLSLPGGSEH